jgi:hypothetical protein
MEDIISIKHCEIPKAIPISIYETREDGVSSFVKAHSEGCFIDISQDNYFQFVEDYHNAIAKKLNHFDSIDEYGNYKIYSTLENGMIRYQKSAVLLKNFTGVTMPKVYRGKFSEKGGRVCDDSNPCCKDFHGTISFNSKDYCPFDCTCTFYFDDQSSPVNEHFLPREGTLICGEVEDDENGNGKRKFKRWFNASEAFAKTWNIIMHGLKHPCVERGRMTVQYLSTTNEVITNRWLRRFKQVEKEILLVSSQKEKLMTELGKRSATYYEVKQLVKKFENMYNHIMLTLNDDYLSDVSNGAPFLNCEEDEIWYPHIYVVIILYCIYPVDNKLPVFDKDWIVPSWFRV